MWEDLLNTVDSSNNWMITNLESKPTQNQWDDSSADQTHTPARHLFSVLFWTFHIETSNAHLPLWKAKLVFKSLKSSPITELPTYCLVLNLQHLLLIFGENMVDLYSDQYLVHCYWWVSLQPPWIWKPSTETAESKACKYLMKLFHESNSKRQLRHRSILHQTLSRWTTKIILCH